MINPPKKLCKECNKNTPHPGRRICISCIQRIAKDKAKIAKVKQENKLKERKQLAKTKKSFSRSSLIKEADRVYSIFIRERDRGNPCITCGTEWTDTQQCGHFMSRKHLSTKWHEKNAHGQCPRCNMFQGGEQFKHGLAIDRMYGPGTAEQIMRLANDSSKTTDEEILNHIKYYYYELDRMMIDYKPKKIYIR